MPRVYSCVWSPELFLPLATVQFALAVYDKELGWELGCYLSVCGTNFCFHHISKRVGLFFFTLKNPQILLLDVTMYIGVKSIPGEGTKRPRLKRIYIASYTSSTKT